jgi:RNA polymerase sigma-70 factor (ECF subfamily)
MPLTHHNAEQLDMSVSDNQLMAQVQAGNRDAFAELMTRHQQRVYSFVRRMLGDTHAAEDIVQDTFLKVWKNASSWKPTGSLQAWILRIAGNLALDHLRKHGRTQILDMACDVEAETTQNVVDSTCGNEREASDLLLTQGQAAVLRDAITRLGPRERQAIELTYFAELQGEQCAKLMGVTHANFRQILARARLELRELLAGYTNGE